MAEESQLGGGHEDELVVTRYGEEPAGVELPAVVLDPLVTGSVGHARIRVVAAVPERVWGRECEHGRELRSRTGIDRLVDGRTRQRNLERELVCHAVAHDEVVPVLEAVTRILRLEIEREVGVGPLESLAEARGQTERTEIHRGRLPYVVCVVLLRPVSRYGE